MVQMNGKVNNIQPKETVYINVLAFMRLNRCLLLHIFMVGIREKLV